MDVFLEQLVKIRLEGKAKAMVFGILAADLLIILLMIGVSIFLGADFLVILILAAVCFGSYKLLSALSVEFEYIITNTDLDIDKITAKSARKRMVSLKLNQVEKYGEYKGQPAPSSVSNTYFFCNRSDDNLVYLIAPTRDQGNVMVVLALDERMREAAEKFIPRLAK